MSRHLNVADLEDVVRHMLEQRKEQLQLLLSAPVYERGLQGLLARLGAGGPDKGPRPLGAELAEADRLHDALGAAIWHMSCAYALHPGLAPELREAAARLTTFVAARSELQRSYLDEAQTAARRAPLLETHREALRQLPTGAGTMEDWVRDFLDAGLEIHRLLQRRAELESTSVVEREGGPLRSEALGFLGRLRAGVQDEVTFRPELPRDLEARLFGYFDMLAGLRTGAAPSTPAAPPTPEVPAPDPEA